ncbi:MAG: hypothetical protein IJR99_14605 [Kiritimatiellae bacterium]|nr:hypothetical protein [Kiritimatiellia bacterium]
MGRLPGFNYKKPFFYMVTLKRLANLAAFSQLFEGEEPPTDAQGRRSCLVENEITRAFERVIRGFAEKWWGLYPINCFAIMPDHIHLLMHIKDSGGQMALGKYVYQLEKALAEEYWRVAAHGVAASELSAAERVGLSGKARSVAPIFEKEWHDWIVMKKGQLAAFTRYIGENPYRAWRRLRHRRYFSTVRRITFAGREWFAYGNAELLERPVIEPFKCSRKWSCGNAEWNAAVARAGRIGPGGAGVGTFMSPGEKECGNAIYRAGGALIVLHPEGFGERWHPSRNKEALCAAGRMLFLSLWEPAAGKPDRATLYRRCHEMGDLVASAIESTLSNDDSTTTS